MFKTKIYNIIILLFIYSCANVQAPSGGPKDKSPPGILESKPLTKTINYGESEIYLQFDKYMNKGSVAKNIRISPELKFTPSWSGKELEIAFEEDLKPNTTYSIILGTEYSDYLGNKPETAFSLIFSTGAELDSGKIEGKLFGDKPSGIFIFAYALDSIDVDTLNIFHTPPSYKIQCGTNGEFTFNALKNGNYRLIAIDDKLKNNVLDEKSDRYSSANSDVYLNDTITPYVAIRLGEPIDRTCPNVVSTMSKVSKLIDLGFDEAIDLNSISIDELVVSDSISDNRTDTKIDIKSIYYLTEKDSNKIQILLDTKLDSSKVWKLDFGKSAISDTLGNIYNDSLERIFYFKTFDGKAKKGKLSSPEIKDSSDNIKIEDYRIVFSKFIEEIGDSAFVLSSGLGKDSVKLDLKYKKDTPKSIMLNLPSILKYEQWYNLKIDYNQIKDNDGFTLADTIVDIDFKTQSEPIYSSISGSFSDSSSSGDNYIMELHSKDYFNFLNLNNNSTWSFSELKKETYTISIFNDANGNNIYDYGFPYPFKFSEKFSQSKQEAIEVKERWDLEDIIIKY